jgi:SAM-dependent methyltransferase
MTAPNDWWQTFFHGTLAEGWLAAMPEEATRQEADFVQQVLQVAPPARLLDVPCGGGRHTRALAARGYDLTAVDLSPTFHEAARSKPSPGPGRVTWEQRDMRDLPWPGTFEGAFSLGNSFGYFDDAGNEAFLRAVARALKPGACFVLDTGYLTEGLLPVLQERTWYEMGGILSLAHRPTTRPTAGCTSSTRPSGTARLRSGRCRPACTRTARCARCSRQPASATCTATAPSPRSRFSSAPGSCS